MTGAQANAGEGIKLTDNTSEKINLLEIKGVTECIQVASIPEIVSDMEDLASIWCRQIEQVNSSNSAEITYF